MIDVNALKIIRRLNNFGYEAYVVGGAVRDLLIGKIPKDYDVVTNASPNQLRRIFRNSRIIGRRFKLVHIYFNNQIIETATFRKDSGKFTTKDKHLLVMDNEFGSIEDDVIRRDFTINALYYDPANETIIDFVNGYEDIKNKKLVCLKNEKISFLEDPVRMIRAVKYSLIIGSKIPEITQQKITKYAEHIKEASSSRLYEEINKIFKSSIATETLLLLDKLDLLQYIIPFLPDELNNETGELLVSKLHEVDKLFKNNKQNTEDHHIYWMILLKNMLDRNLEEFQNGFLLQNIKQFFSETLMPIRAPKKICEDLARGYFYYIKYFCDEIDISKIQRYVNMDSFYFTFKLYSLYGANDPDIIKSIEKIRKNSQRNKNKTFVNKSRKKRIHSDEVSLRKGIKNAKRVVETKKNIK